MGAGSTARLGAWGLGGGRVNAPETASAGAPRRNRGSGRFFAVKIKSSLGCRWHLPVLLWPLPPGPLPADLSRPIGVVPDDCGMRIAQCGMGRTQ